MKKSFGLTLFIAVFLALPLQAAMPRVIFNGGITLDERQEAPDNGTKLEFFVTGGSYLSDISVIVKDDRGREVVNTVTKGPWLILDLPEGIYTVQATRSNGDVQGGNIEVSSDGEKFSYMFPEA